jgi:hypothetical protein
MVDPLIVLEPGMSEIRKGNIMARARMIVAYDQSEAFKGLVLGTGNKTEILLGYTTLYGDSACALNPIGDLYKTQVRQLARGLGIPDAIIAKPPSADLWTGQTPMRKWTNCSICLLTNATAPRNVWKRGLVGISSAWFLNASAGTSSNVSCLPLPSLAAEPWDTISFIYATGEHNLIE